MTDHHPDKRPEVSSVTRIATCRCGQLSVTCTGEPVRVSVCHCYDCQQRSGSAFAAKARFSVDVVTFNGDAKRYEHVADSGNTADFHFCPTCGSTLWFQARPHLDLISVPIGNFADKDFPAPSVSIYEKRMHPWVTINGDDIQHHD